MMAVLRYPQGCADFDPLYLHPFLVPKIDIFRARQLGAKSSITVAHI
jgi:hypothetical protein